MANVTEDVSFTIGAKDNTKEGINSVKAGLQSLADASASMSDKMVAHWEKFKGAYVAVSAAVASAAATIKKAWDAASKAADYLEQMQMLDALAAKYDTTAQAIVEKVKSMSDGLISSSTAASVSMAAIAKGLSPDMIYDLAEASKTLSDVMGMTANEAFKQMAEALEANKTKSLKLAVGIIDLKEKYGEASDQWTESAKQLAFLNLIKEKAAEITRAMGDAEDSVADKMERFKNQIAEAEKAIGMVLIRGMMLATAVMQGFNAAVLVGIAAIEKLVGSSDIAADAFRQAEDMAKKSADNFKLALAPEEEWIKVKKRGVAAAKEMTASLGEQERTIKATTDAMLKMIPAVAKWEEAQLKMADSKYKDALKSEGATIDSMRASMTEYLAVVNKVYTARIEGEKAIEAAMKAAKSKPEDITKASLEALKQEQEMHTKRLDAWKDYYDKLKSMHEKATEAVKKSEEAIKKLQNDMHKDNVENANIRMGLMEKEAAAKGIAATDESIRSAKLAELQRRLTESYKLSGEERVQEQKSIQQVYATLTDAVTRAGEVYDRTQNKYVKANIEVKSSLESVQDAYKNQAMMEAELAKSRSLQMAEEEEKHRKNVDAVKSLADAMKQAQNEIKGATDKVNELSTQIGSMEKSIALQVDTSQVQAAAAQLNALSAQLAALAGKASAASPSSSSRTPEGGTQNINPWGPGWAGGYTDTGSPIITQGDLPGGDFAMGGVFSGGKVVPFANGGIFNRPTLFPMARGYGLMGEAGPEAVMPLSRGRDGKLGVKASGGGQVINFNPVINVSGAKSPEQIAREIVKPLQAEMRRLGQVS